MAADPNELLTPKQAAAEMGEIDSPLGKMEKECLQGLPSRILEDLLSGRGGLEIAFVLAHEASRFDKMTNEVQREKVRFVDHLAKLKCLGFVEPGPGE